MSEEEIKNLNKETDDLLMDIRLKKLRDIDTTALEEQAQSNIDKSRKMREHLENRKKKYIEEARARGQQTKQVIQNLNRLDTGVQSQSQLEPEPQPEPEPEPEPQPQSDINTYKCVALKEITNFLWSNKNKREVVDVVIDLLYDISKSEDTEEIQKLVEIYRRQTGQGKKKKKSSKTRKKKGGKTKKKRSKTKKKRSKIKK